MKILTASSLDKIFPNGGVTLPERSGVMLQNERYHFQIAVCQDNVFGRQDAQVQLIGDIADFCTVRAVDCSPALFNRYPDADDYYIFTSDDARLYPDVLREENSAYLPMRLWAAFWVTVHSENGIPAGKHTLKIKLCSGGEVLGETEYTVEVLAASLPKSDLIHTCWMHYDAIANYYRLAPWSREYYKKFESFLSHAVSHGMNMLYVPLFTPPLDTCIGGERLDVQLLKITKRGSSYRFDLSELEKFLDFALSHGVEYFEMCHLATQWGAAHCPKIMAHTENGYEQIFGWNSLSTSEEYLDFLRACLGEIDTLLRKKGIAKKCYFHISDEPDATNIDRYKEVYHAIAPILKNYKLMDAVSDAGRDLIDVPVVSTTHLKGECAANEFAYYCCSAHSEYLSNRFLDMPSLRNRILGCQLWLNKANGFLHWGFNFYNDRGSVRSIDPFRVTDALGHFPGGDGFVVYPGCGGAWDSLRLEVFYDALQDRMLLKELEKKLGRATLVKILNDYGIRGWTEYPHTETAFIAFNANLKRMLV